MTREQIKVELQNFPFANLHPLTPDMTILFAQHIAKLDREAETYKPMTDDELVKSVNYINLNRSFENNLRRVERAVIERLGLVWSG